MWENIKRAIRFLLGGQFRRVWNEVHVRLFRGWWELAWPLSRFFRARGRLKPRVVIDRQTEHPVAWESPDHLVPFGTAENNSTNKKFVLHMDKKLRQEFGDVTLRVMDLGCSGGQMVADFLRLQWIGVGLEGSDFSLNRRRANWAALANRNLFTCDITKPYQVRLDGWPATFHLITAWEVLEHIATPDLPAVFENILKHLEDGGYFIASTTETSDVQKGVELHQTRWTNAQWRAFVQERYPVLEAADVGLKIYQFVRYNFLHPSFLLYRKKTTDEKQA